MAKKGERKVEKIPVIFICRCKKMFYIKMIFFSSLRRRLFTCALKSPQTAPKSPFMCYSSPPPSPTPKESTHTAVVFTRMEWVAGMFFFLHHLSKGVWGKLFRQGRGNMKNHEGATTRKFSYAIDFEVLPLFKIPPHILVLFMCENSREMKNP